MPHFLLAIVGLILIFNGINYSQIRESENTCYSRTDFFKKIEDDKLTTLVKAESDSTHYIEIMITPYAGKEVVVVEYEKQRDDNKDNSMFCVKGQGTKSNINKDIIDELYQALEKLRGTRA